MIDQLDDLHVTLDTCGNAPPEEFMRVVERCRLVLLDLKIADPKEHHRWTGCDNRLILHNLGLLAATDIPFIIRVPLIPGVTDTDQNLLGIARILAAMPATRGSNCSLTIRRGAGGKYAACGIEWRGAIGRKRSVSHEFGTVQRIRTGGITGMKMSVSSRATESEEMLELSPRLAQMKHDIREGKHHRFRNTDTPDLVSECDAEHLSWMQRSSRLTRRMCELERVVIEPDERIVFTRTIRKVPPLYPESAVCTLAAGRTFHELGPISNICADWGMVLSEGLLARKQTALSNRERMHSDAAAVEFFDCAIEAIDAALALATRYAANAREAYDEPEGEIDATGHGGPIVIPRTAMAGITRTAWL